MFTKITGSKFRPSLFGAGVADGRTFYLGQTPYDWFTRAQAAVALFENLKARAESLANKSDRDQILAWIGPAGSSDTPMERYLTVVEDIRFTSEGENMAQYGISRLQNRVTKLENYNNELNTKVRAAEMVTGNTSPIGPRPATPIRPGPAGTATTAAVMGSIPTWAWIAGGVALAGLLVFAIAKKK